MSTLLPKSSAQEFQQKGYWDSFFKKRGSAFEWYGEYTDLCHILHKYLKPSSRILMAGCGNSLLSESLYDAGFEEIDNIDISSVVINQKKSSNKTSHKGMTFTKMDVMAMTFEDSMYDSVIDKGTLDAIFSATDAATVEKVSTMFSEIERVLKLAGRYICITLAQSHILEKLLDYFSSWLIRLYKVQLDAKGGSVGGALPVFVFVCTKMARREGLPTLKVYECVMDDGKYVRVDELGKLKDFVQSGQQYAMIEQHLSKLRVGEMAIQLDLWSPGISTEPRYSFAVIDIQKKKAKNGPFAIFIVPQGREVEWLFSSEPGRLQLAESAGFERLVVVSMHHGHTYSCLEAVKEEVSAKAMELAQCGLPAGRKFPVLSLGEGIGSRVVLYEGFSSFSGCFVIEEGVEQDGEGRVRRLVFLNSPSMPQTEVKMISDKSGKSKAKNTIPKLDHSTLTFGYHNTFVAALALLPDLPDLSSAGGSKLEHVHILQVGLGGGALSVFISKYLHNVTMDVVEIDPEIVSVAEKWFGFMQGKKLKVFVDDGIHFIREIFDNNKKGIYDAVFLDVNSKDTTSGMNAPPKQFLGQEFLDNVKFILKPSGIFLTNLVARNKEMKVGAIKSLLGSFPRLLSISLPEDINEVVVGLPATISLTEIISGDKAGPENLEYGCKVSQGCCVTEMVLEKVSSLSQMVQTSSSGTVVACQLCTKLQDSLSKLSLYCE